MPLLGTKARARFLLQVVTTMKVRFSDLLLAATRSEYARAWLQLTAMQAAASMQGADAAAIFTPGLVGGCSSPKSDMCLLPWQQMSV